MSGYEDSRIGRPWKGYYLSAYGIAVKHGFVGTEEEWLESLNGKSAYEAAVEAGYEGTEAEFYELLGSVASGAERAEAAQAAAEAARSGAETARDEAESAADAAAGSAASAEASEAGAASAASAAAGSAERAVESADASAGARALAENAKNAAQAARDEAALFAGTAEESAASAAGSATAAKASEEQASKASGAADESAKLARSYAEQAKEAAGGDFATNSELEEAKAALQAEIEGLTAEDVGADPSGAAAAVRSDLDAHTGSGDVHVTAEQKAAWSAKQDALTFDAAPASGSINPVTSGGVYTAENATRAMLAPVEASGAASQAYAAGDLLVFNGVLCKVTAAIAQGGTITPGTNVDVSESLATSLQKVTQDLAGKLSATESAEYPGCYYRTVSGVTEWLNPPLALSTEYRTTERYNGKPVYRQIKTIYTCVGNETGRYVASITADVAQVVDCKIKQLWSDIGSNSGMFIPGYSETTGEMDGLNCTVYWGNGHIYMRLYFAAKPTAGYQIMCDVKYTKTTD